MAKNVLVKSEKKKTFIWASISSRMVITFSDTSVIHTRIEALFFLRDWLEFDYNNQTKVKSNRNVTVLYRTVKL